MVPGMDGESATVIFLRLVQYSLSATMVTTEIRKECHSQKSFTEGRNLITAEEGPQSSHPEAAYLWVAVGFSLCE